MRPNTSSNWANCLATQWPRALRRGSRKAVGVAWAAVREGAELLRAFLDEPRGILPWRGWTVDGELVWGATAAIVRGFVAILRELGVDQ